MRSYFANAFFPLPLRLHKKILVLSKPFATSDFWVNSFFFFQSCWPPFSAIFESFIEAVALRGREIRLWSRMKKTICLRKLSPCVCRRATMVAPNCIIGRATKQNDRVNKINAFFFYKCIFSSPSGIAWKDPRPLQSIRYFWFLVNNLIVFSKLLATFSLQIS